MPNYQQKKTTTSKCKCIYEKQIIKATNKKATVILKRDSKQTKTFERQANRLQYYENWARLFRLI